MGPILPTEVMIRDHALSDSPVAAVIGPDTCFQQIEFVGILKGTAHRALAEKFVDFMLERTIPGRYARPDGRLSGRAKRYFTGCVCQVLRKYLPNLLR